MKKLLITCMIIILAGVCVYLIADTYQARTGHYEDRARLEARVDSLERALDSHRAREAYRKYLALETQAYYQDYLKMQRIKPD